MSKICNNWGWPAHLNRGFGFSFIYLFTLDWAQVKEDPSLLLLFLSAGATFWVTCSPRSSLSTTEEESVLSFWVIQGSLSLRARFELCWRDLLPFTLPSPSLSRGISWRDWEGQNWEKQLAFMFPSPMKPEILMGGLGKKTESRRKGGCWYEKAAIFRAFKFEKWKPLQKMIMMEERQKLAVK